MHVFLMHNVFIYIKLSYISYIIIKMKLLKIKMVLSLHYLTDYIENIFHDIKVNMF